jgi:hypothetical protein
MLGMLRLIRRSLLCVLVGVVVFGGVGWLARPRAHWTAKVDASPSTYFIGGGEGSTPVWARVQRDFLDKDGFEIALDSATGAVLSRTEPVKNEDRWATALDDGRLFVETTKRPLEAKSETHFAIYEAGKESSVKSWRLDGRWRTTPSKRFAWRSTRAADGTRLHVVSLLGDGEGVRRLFRGSNHRANSFVCTDGGLTAFHTASEDAPDVPTGVEVWDLEKDRRIANAEFPQVRSITSEAYVGHPSFSESNRFVDSDLWITQGGNRFVGRYSFDVHANRLNVNLLKPAVEPPNGVDDAIPAVEHRLDGYEVWTSESPNQYSFWWCLEHRGEVVVPWRRAPHSEDSPRHYDANGRDQRIAATTRIVPLDLPWEFLFQTREPHWSSSLPEVARRWLPKRWDRSPGPRFRWHDVRTNDYLDIGSDSSTQNAHWTKSAFFTTSSSENGDTLLQSWPLPPRDPKKPAMAAAVVAMAATWWFFHRRAKKRAAA